MCSALSFFCLIILLRNKKQENPDFFFEHLFLFLKLNYLVFSCTYLAVFILRFNSKPINKIIALK